MSTTTLSRLALAALAVTLAACADSTSPTANVSDTLLTYDAAVDAGQSAALDVSQMTAGEAAAGVPSASAPMAGTACTWSATTGRYTCPTVTTAEGLSLDRSYAYFAGGTAQQSYDATATDSINFQWALAGTLTGTNATTWVHATRSATVSGLAGTETQRTWNGSGSRTDSSVVTSDGRTRKARIDATSTMNNVVFKLPRSTYPYPQSGTITHDATITATYDGASATTSRTATRHVVVTFDGTRTASLVIGTKQCTLDLPTRAVTCP